MKNSSCVDERKKRLRNRILISIVVLFSVLTITGVIAGVRLFAQEGGAGGQVLPEIQPLSSQERATISKFAFIAAAIAFGLGALGAGLAIGNVGAAAMGAVAEKPEIAGQALIFVALAEGLVIFGFITALMILGKV
ncbi:MAG: ATP synthase subunit C [Spirochaetota bacterium]